MQYDNRYLYEGSNLYLRPEYIHNVELSGVYKWLCVSGDYNYRDKSISPRFVLYNGQDIACMSVFYIDHMHDIYASMVAITYQLNTTRSRYKGTGGGKAEKNRLKVLNKLV